MNWLSSIRNRAPNTQKLETRWWSEKTCAALVFGTASALTGMTASAEPQLVAEVLDQATLAKAHAPASTTVAATATASRYGQLLQVTIQKFPDLKGAILNLDSAFFSRQAGPETNQAVRLSDGSEVLLMSGCRNAYLCSETGYLVGSDFTHRQVALLEVVNAGQPRSYRYAGSREPALRALLLQRGIKVFAKAAPDPDAAALRGIRVSAVTPAMDGLFQARPDFVASILRVYPGANSLAVADEMCGIQMADGRRLTLMSAQTSDADGHVQHAIATEDKTKKTFVYRAEDQLGKEGWFGSPDAALRTVLSVGSGGCTALRGKLGLDPKGKETSVAASR
jgi:hypothetical protein